jgi:hypothetical protein
MLQRPYLPSPAKAPPAGPDWLHEIKHDGFRILAQRDADMRRYHFCTARDAVLPLSIRVDSSIEIASDK